jgi:hypothetical protein
MEVNKHVTLSECAILLDAIHSTQSSLNTLIHDNMTSIRAEIKASSDMTNLRIDELTGKVSTQNGNVAKLQQLSNDRQEVINDFRRLEKEARDRREWPRKNWVLLAIGGFVLVLAVMVLYDLVGLRGIIELARGIR